MNCDSGPSVQNPTGKPSAYELMRFLGCHCADLGLFNAKMTEDPLASLSGRSEGSASADALFRHAGAPLAAAPVRCFNRTRARMSGGSAVGIEAAAYCRGGSQRHHRRAKFPVSLVRGREYLELS